MRKKIWPPLLLGRRLCWRTQPQKVLYVHIVISSYFPLQHRNSFERLKWKNLRLLKWQKDANSRRRNLDALAFHNLVVLITYRWTYLLPFFFNIYIINKLGSYKKNINNIFKTLRKRCSAVLHKHQSEHL